MPKEVPRSRKSKDRQYNSQKKNDKKRNNGLYKFYTENFKIDYCEPHWKLGMNSGARKW
jgi:hypothetical protein